VLVCDRKLSVSLLRFHCANRHSGHIARLLVDPYKLLDHVHLRRPCPCVCGVCAGRPLDWFTQAGHGGLLLSEGARGKHTRTPVSCPFRKHLLYARAVCQRTGPWALSFRRSRCVSDAPSLYTLGYALFFDARADGWQTMIRPDCYLCYRSTSRRSTGSMVQHGLHSGCSWVGMPWHPFWTHSSISQEYRYTRYSGGTGSTGPG
jgi:hypothetical protein